MMIIIIFIVLVFDIVSKIIVDKHMMIGDSIPVVKNIFNLTYVKNTGVAWSMFDNMTIMVSVISCIIILMLLFYIYKHRPANIFDKIGYGFIIGGALGNFFDRIINGCVIDFIDIKIFGYDYPIFNLADTFIVIGAILLVIHAWRDNKNGDKGRKQ